MFNYNEIMAVARFLNIDFSKFSFKDFKRRILVELEHGKYNSLTNVTDDDLLKIFKITLVHLNHFSYHFTPLLQT